MKNTISNKRIDHYRLTRHYGQAHYEQCLLDITSGVCRALDKEIKQGQYGPEALAALERRTGRTKSRAKARKALTQAQLDAALDFLKELDARKASSSTS